MNELHESPRVPHRKQRNRGTKLITQFARIDKRKKFIKGTMIESGIACSGRGGGGDIGQVQAKKGGADLREVWLNPTFFLEIQI